MTKQTSNQARLKELNPKINQQIRCPGDLKGMCKCNKRLFDVVSGTIEIVCPKCGTKMVYTLMPVFKYGEATTTEQI